MRSIARVIRHEWPSGARFCFNCYQHFALLVNHGAIGKPVIILNQGVTQGDPLSMICYGIGILPLISMLKSEVTAARQQWFADGSTAEKFVDIRGQFERRQQLGLNDALELLFMQATFRCPDCWFAMVWVCVAVSKVFS